MKQQLAMCYSLLALTSLTIAIVFNHDFLRGSDFHRVVLPVTSRQQPEALIHDSYKTF